jgi:predicted aspartyl protease
MEPGPYGMIRSMIRTSSFVAALLLVLATRPSLSEAQIYRWVDDRGGRHYSQGIDTVPEKFRKTAVPLDLRNTPAVPSGPAPAGGPAASAASTIQIKFEKGQPIVADATINGTTAAKLVVDTAAARTQIVPRVLTAAGVLPAKDASGETQASGTTGGPTVQIGSLAVGGLRVEKFSVVAQDTARENVDGLLGRDFLDRFQVVIDSDNGIATLSPRGQ